MTNEFRQAPPDTDVPPGKAAHTYYPSVRTQLRLCGDQPTDHDRVWSKPLPCLDTWSFLGQRQLVSRPALKAPCEAELQCQQATPTITSSAHRGEGPRTPGKNERQMRRHHYKTKHFHLVRQSLSLETPWRITLQGWGPTDKIVSVSEELAARTGLKIFTAQSKRRKYKGGPKGSVVLPGISPVVKTPASPTGSEEQ